jgi:hypothetical protein
MDTKLTLKLNKQIIEKAKEYASNKQMSLSRIVESYLQSLTTEKNEKNFEISPFVRSIATGVEIPGDLEMKDEYSEHLLQKYK